MIEHQRAAEGSTQWYDADAGPLVRPYARSGLSGAQNPEQAQAPLDLVTELVAVTDAAEPDPALLGQAHRTLLTLCRAGPLTVAELGATADLSTGVARTLLHDLLAAGQLTLHGPARPGALPEELPVQELIEGLRAL